MDSVSPLIKAFFDEYEQGANNFDITLNKQERDKLWLVANPHGIGVAYNDDSFPEKLEQRRKQLQAIGYMSARITSLEELRLDDHYSLIKTAWRQKYQKGEVMAEVDITVDYIVRRIDNKAVKIICSIAHEDEEELLRAKGIVE